jgi:hypothetical protein
MMMADRCQVLISRLIVMWELPESQLTITLFLRTRSVHKGSIDSLSKHVQ